MSYFWLLLLRYLSQQLVTESTGPFEDSSLVKTNQVAGKSSELEKRFLSSMGCIYKRLVDLFLVAGV